MLHNAQLYLSGWVGGATAYLGGATAYLVGGLVGVTVIIGLVSVQVKLKLDLPTGTELGNIFLLYRH